MGVPLPLLAPPHRVPMPWAEYITLDADVPGEYFDGRLMMAPSPDQQHQLVSRRLANLLELAVPDGYTVNTGWQWSPADGQSFIPDVMVYASTRESTKLTATPVLAVEVLSQNRADDLVVQTSRYASAGLVDYWVVDRAAGELLVYRLHDGVYEQAHVVGTQPVEVSIGIAAVTVNIADLLR
jgi:Uma2 family endonuclease